MTDTKTHAEIEAEIYDLIIAAKGYTKDAQAARDDIKAAAGELKAATSDQQGTAEQLATLRKQIRKDAREAVAAEAGKLRKSAIMAEWMSIALAAVVGAAVGAALIGWISGAF